MNQKKNTQKTQQQQKPMSSVKCSYSTVVGAEILICKHSLHNLHFAFSSLCFYHLYLTWDIDSHLWSNSLLRTWEGQAQLHKEKQAI